MALLKKKQKFELSIDFGNDPQLNISDIFESIVIECNYRIIQKSDRIVTFEPYGDKSISLNDASLYINGGKFEFIQEGATGGIVRLSYFISYDFEFILLLFLIPLGIFVSPIVFVICLIVILPSMYGYYRTNKHAKEMLFAIVDG